MSRLLHVGNAIVDIALTIDALPPVGGDVIADGSAITAGGAVNTLVAAVRDGLPAVHLGARGTGPFADVVASALSEVGVDAVGPVVPDLDVGFSIVLVDAAAERTFVTRVGAEARLTRESLAAVPVADDDTVVVTGYALQHSGAAITSWLDTLPGPLRVVLDPSPIVATLDRGVLAAVLARADVVSANAREARLLLGGAADSSPRQNVAALTALLRPGAVALVRDGADGCWVGSPGGAVSHVPGFAVDAVDTTGAGDAHLGVLCAALARGESLPAAVRRANAAAALAVTRRGPATAPSAAEIDALLAR